MNPKWIRPSQPLIPYSKHGFIKLIQFPYDACSSGTPRHSDNGPPIRKYANINCGAASDGQESEMRFVSGIYLPGGPGSSQSIDELESRCLKCLRVGERLGAHDSSHAFLLVERP